MPTARNFDYEKASGAVVGGDGAALDGAENTGIENINIAIGSAGSMVVVNAANADKVFASTAAGRPLTISSVR